MVDSFSESPGNICLNGPMKVKVNSSGLLKDVSNRSLACLQLNSLISEAREKRRTKGEGEGEGERGGEEEEEG